MHLTLSHILLSDVSLLTFPTMSTAGPFPVVKQEQLSPRSSSSQADNLSTQGTSHEGASGRGKWLSCSFIQFAYMVYLSWGLVSIFLVPCSGLTMRLPASRGNEASQVYFNLFTFFPLHHSFHSHLNIQVKS